MDGHIHLKNKNRVDRILTGFYDKFSLFIQRDMKKEGITKPRELLKAILEALHEKYPDIEIYSYTSFYDTFELILEDGSHVFPDRGHGLGMANSLTTIMQLTIHEMISNELINDIPSFDGECLCINDDQVAGFSDEYHMESYWDKEDEIMEKLSLIRQPKKSFLSRLRFVLAERYFTPYGEYEKISYQRRELLYPLACFNVTHAKEYFISAQNYTDCSLHRVYMEELKSYWGYEFHPREFDYPSKLGGWMTDKLMGVDLTLITLDSLPQNNLLTRGFKASAYRHHIKPRGELFKPAWLKFYGDPKIPEEFEKHFDIASTTEINWKYGRLLKSSEKEFKTYYETLKKERQSIFKKQIELTYDDLITSILSRYNTTQFYPNESMISCYHKGNYVDINIEDFYIDPNPSFACIKI